VCWCRTGKVNELLSSRLEQVHRGRNLASLWIQSIAPHSPTPLENLVAYGWILGLLGKEDELGMRTILCGICRGQKWNLGTWEPFKTFPQLEFV
jgi:hypothetical protein